MTEENPGFRIKCGMTKGMDSRFRGNDKKGCGMTGRGRFHIRCGMTRREHRNDGRNIRWQMLWFMSIAKE
jgi:hypothetical protein